MPHALPAGLRMPLDPVGLSFACVTSPERPATFSLTAHLTESVEPKVLQWAVDDVFRRMPFLCGRLRRGVWSSTHELLPSPPAVAAGEGHTFTPFYEAGDGHALRVLAGERSITAEAFRAVCDGPGLAAFLTAVLTRYFAVGGCAVVDAAPKGQACIEEAENAFARYGNAARTAVPRPVAPAVAHRLEPARTPSPRVLSRTYDVAAIESAAGALGASVDQYVLGHVLAALRAHRDAHGGTDPVAAMVQIDCRTSLPSTTYRSFVVPTTVTAPESGGVMAAASAASRQLAVDADVVLAKVYDAQRSVRRLRFLPAAAQVRALRRIDRRAARGLTTTFSGLGQVRLPRAVEAHVERLEHVVGAQAGQPVTFAAVAVGSALTVTATVEVEDDAVARAVLDGLERVAGARAAAV